MTSAATLIWKNALAMKSSLDKYDKERVKAAQTAAKVEGFNLSKMLKKELSSGVVAGKQLKPMTRIGSLWRKGKKPLSPLSKTVRYAAKKTGGTFNVEVGFIDPGRGKPLSKSWKRIAQKQQEGFSTRPITKSFRSSLAQIGDRLSKRSQFRKYMFLKKSTTRFKIPARPIIDPFWDANRDKSQRNIMLNWERKMAGERI